VLLITNVDAPDLRSRLSWMKGGVELTLLGPEYLEAYRQTLEQALGEIDIIQTTFNDLLAIAEAESGASRTRLEPLALDEIVADVAEIGRASCRERGEFCGVAVVLKENSCNERLYSHN